jgi:hypothetical protein
MPLNIPTGSTDNISFGPAKIKMDVFTGTNGVTPTSDVGFIGEDGVTIEMTSEKRNIVQGNPQLINFSFATSQTAMINFTSIEWNFESFRLAIGAGTTGTYTTNIARESGVAAAAATTHDVTAEYFSFGGNPLNTFVCMSIEHQMAVTGDTLYAHIWKAQSESGFSLPFGSEEHQFEFSFQAIRAINDWGGTELDFDQQLMKLVRMPGVTQYG